MTNIIYPPRIIEIISLLNLMIFKNQESQGHNNGLIIVDFC